MKNITLKQKLKKNKLTIGSWITIGHPSVAEIMSSAGFDWLTIDMEHNSIDPAMMQTLIATIQANNVAALVRVAKNEEVAIKHAMDAGADGVIVPMINSGDDAARAVSYVKYPPKGKRGVGLSRAQKYGNGFNEYIEWLSNHSIVIAQIEHINGIDTIDEILTTDGIDGTIVGPYDLSGSLGVPGQIFSSVVNEAINTYEHKCLEHRKPMGFHIIHPNIETLNIYMSKKYSFLALSTDFLVINSSARNILKDLKT